MWALPEPDGNRFRRPAAPDQAARLNPVRTLHICSFSIRSKTRPPPTRSGATRPVGLPGRRPHVRVMREGDSPPPCWTGWPRTDSTSRWCRPRAAHRAAYTLHHVLDEPLDVAVPAGHPLAGTDRYRSTSSPRRRLDLRRRTARGHPARRRPAAGVPSAGRACRRRVGRQAGVRGGRSRRRPGPGAGRRVRAPPDIALLRVLDGVRGDRARAAPDTGRRGLPPRAAGSGGAHAHLSPAPWRGPLPSRDTAASGIPYP